jgi:hypothetical protein
MSICSLLINKGIARIIYQYFRFFGKIEVVKVLSDKSMTNLERAGSSRYFLVGVGKGDI